MNILCAGTRKTGKSTLALYIALQWGGTVIIFDPRGSYRGVGIQCDSVTDLMEHLDSQDYIVDGVPQVLVVFVDADPEETFRELTTALFPPRFEGWQGRVALIVDEARTLQSHAYIAPELDRLVGQHPYDDVLIIQTAHEIKEFNTKNKSVMHEMYLFYQIGQMNYGRIEEFCGSDVADTVDGFRPKFKGDPVKHHYVRFSFEETLGANGEQWEVCTDPATWYIELGSQNRLPGNKGNEDTESASNGESD